MISVIVPAHNEARVIGRLLERLVSAAQPGELEVIVVANGCADDTATIAAGFGPPVKVLTMGAASKAGALRAGDEAAQGFPRVYVDADVELGTEDLRALSEAVSRPGILAAAPERELAMAGRPWTVRWYFDIWSRLPEVRSGLFGRGVIAVHEAGYARIASLPPLLGDDLAASLTFTPEEKVVVPRTRVVVHPPRTVGDLLRRRIRVAQIVAQIEQDAGAPDSTARTQLSDLVAMAREKPSLAPKIAVFLTVALVARTRANRMVRRGDYSTWLRDESSRT